jgi:hypothetical protein
MKQIYKNAMRNIHAVTTTAGKSNFLPDLRILFQHLPVVR